MASLPTKIALKFEKPTVEAKPSQVRSILFALILGMVGALLNCFPVELAYSISLVIGNLAFILAAAYLRPALTLLCAVICVSPLFIIWGHPFGFLTFGLEALFVSYMRSRGWYLPTADFIYWLLIGIPLTAALIWLNEPDTQGYLLFSLFKQSINAIFYTSLAVIILLILGDKLNLCVKSQQPALVKNLKQYLHYIFWIMSAFFVVGVSLYLSRNLNEIQEQQFEDKLDISSQYVSRIIENYVDEHKKAIAQIANKLSLVGPTDYDESLSKTHALYPGFLTMLIANRDAALVTSSPRSLMDNLPKSGFTISDRSYFVQAFYHQSLYTSPVFLGRGFGSDPIIAISAPIYAKNSTNPIGIVEGSLNLNMFDQVNRYAVNDRQVEVVLTDENDNVIYAESGLALTKLAKFNASFEHVKLRHKFMMINTHGANMKRYLYRKVTLNNGWKVLVLIEHGQFLQSIERQYLTIFMSLSLIFVFVLLLANQFAHILNRPLAFALKELAKDDNKAGYKAIPYDAPTEFVSLYEELQQSKATLLKHQLVLEEKVAKRTKELHKANKALVELAHKDSLTGLYNRRYLESKFSELQAVLSRNDAAMVVAMLDLDHFKKLNDQYGHLVGDNCLTYVGELMKRKFDRRSDIVARFGGEEFIIAAQHDEKNGVLRKLDELREEIAQYCFSFDGEQSVSITMSIGVVVTDARLSDNIDAWIKLADEQLYQSKNNGRNQLSVKHLI